MVEQFGRNTVLEALRPGGGDSRAWTDDFRIKLSVTHSREPSQNSAKVSVWNLTDASVDYLRNDDNTFRLLAGYSTPRQLFVGQAKRGGIRARSKGPERVVELELADGNQALKRTYLNKTFATGTKISRVVKYVARQTGLPESQIQIPDDVRLDQGVTLGGTSDRVLARLSEAAGADFWVQDGQIKFLKKRDDTGIEAAEFSVENGSLIGSPEPGERGSVKFKGLLRPKLRPGDLLQVVHNRYGGVWRARDVKFVGDSGYGSPFYVTVTARPAGD